MELRERVAIALYESDTACYEYPWAGMGDGLRGEWYTKADRILALVESDTQRREREAWMACQRWRGWKEATDDAALDEAASRYGGGKA